jgi:hydroxymethylpyrimidine/phosphomethylpyrimidine kinase
MAVITGLTAQNTTGVKGVELPSPAFVGAQLRAVLDDIDVASWTALTSLLLNLDEAITKE